MLVVISIISILAAITLPTLTAVRQRARDMQNAANQGQVASVLNLYAADNSERYPPAVATIGRPGNRWNWQEPLMLASPQRVSPQSSRSMSAHLSSYIDAAEILSCPSSPRQYSYLQSAWEQGDDWNHPQTGPEPDPLNGVHCFYWNYVGLLVETQRVFKGPTGPAGTRAESKMLTSDFLAFDHWPTPNAISCCKNFKGAGATPELYFDSPYWYRELICGEPAVENIAVKLCAGYIDGHVESYKPEDTAPMQVSITPDGLTPYPAATHKGVFYLPRAALPQSR